MSTTALDQPTFDYVRKLVHDRAAIALEAGKGYLVESRLLPLAQQHGQATLREFIDRLKAQPYGELHAQVVEAMTTNETSFFRDVHPFEALRKDVLPPLLDSRTSRKSLRIWSAACSSGQEPYSIAMLLLEHFPQLHDWSVQIFASDLSQQMIERARSGSYSQLEVNRGLPAALLVKYFRQSGPAWEVMQPVQRRVQFFPLNLIEPWPSLPVMDVIFIRNVLIYFTPETKLQILSKVQRQLAQGGTLLLGAAETTIGIDESWQRVDHGKTSSYRQSGTK